LTQWLDEPGLGLGSTVPVNAIVKCVSRVGQHVTEYPFTYIGYAASKRKHWIIAVHREWGMRREKLGTDTGISVRVARADSN
jgi:hypothetical protein